MHPTEALPPKPPEPDLSAHESPPETKGYVYLFRADTGVYKIGSSANPMARLQAFSGLPFTVELVHQMPSNDPLWVERLLHRRFAEKRVRGEWYALDEADVAAIVATPRCDRPGWVRRAKTGAKRRGWALRGQDPAHEMVCRPLQVRLPSRLRRQLEAMAERNCSTLTTEIVAAIRARLEAHGLWPPPELKK